MEPMELTLPVSGNLEPPSSPESSASTSPSEASSPTSTENSPTPDSPKRPGTCESGWIERRTCPMPDHVVEYRMAVDAYFCLNCNVYIEPDCGCPQCQLR